MMQDTAILRQLVEAGRAGDLYDIMLEISQYCSPTRRRRPMNTLSREESHLFVISSHHLYFVARHGFTTAICRDEHGHAIAPYPEEFEAWVQRGAPGLSKRDIAEYLSKKPLPSSHHLTER